LAEGLITARYPYSRPRNAAGLFGIKFCQDDQKKWYLVCAEATNQIWLVPKNQVGFTSVVAKHVLLYRRRYAIPELKT